MLTTEQIQKTVAAYFKDKPVERVYLFGSYARGEADEQSDIDLLVDLDQHERTGWTFYTWHQELENIFEQKTDVIANAAKPEHTSNWRLIERINKEKVLIYERA
jgi:predicted nucleotidyltransferase